MTKEHVPRCCCHSISLHVKWPWTLRMAPFVRQLPSPLINDLAFESWLLGDLRWFQATSSGHDTMPIRPASVQTSS